MAASTDAVAVMAPVVIGDLDPYQAVKSLVRVPKAQTVNDGETPTRGLRILTSPPIGSSKKKKAASISNRRSR